MIRPARIALVLMGLCAGRAWAQAVDIECDAGDTEVRRLVFNGNRTFADDVLANGIATTAATWLRRTLRVVGARYCLDSLAVRTDSLRLVGFYRLNGFPDVRIGTEIRPVSRGRVDVRFQINEGRPIIVDSLAFTFPTLDTVPERERMLRGLPLRVGDRFDTHAIEVTRDTLGRRLRDRGYPLAEVLRSFATDDTAKTASVEFQVYTGPRVWIERIDVEVDGSASGGDTHIDPDQVRSVLGIRTGQLYNEASLESVKRGLYLTEAFRLITIGIDTASLEDERDSLIVLDVTLVEADSRAARLSAGWGTLDCLRAQGAHTNYAFLGGLRRIDLTGRVSKVGIDPPFDFARGLCTSELRNDPLSDTLNYYGGVTYSQPALFRLRTIPTVTVYSERRSEYQAFIRATPIGVIGSLQQGIDGTWPMTWSYQLEYGRTIAQPAFFCAVFNVCEDAARAQLERLTRTAVAGWSLTRNLADNNVNPTRGSVLRFELRHASSTIGSSPNIQFNRATVDASVYVPAGTGALAFRLRGGTVIGSRLSLSGRPTFIPLQERLYAGGPNTVRGYRQNELGPAIYVPNEFETIEIPGHDTLAYFRADPSQTGQRVVPTGGDNLVVANIELRQRSFFLPELVQYALFLDAGQVWNRGRSATGINFRDIRTTPGAGVRVYSPIGPVRVDIGYNPYDLPAGPAYFNPPPTADTDQVVRLICVSPGNNLRVRLPDETRPAQQIDQGECPATYAPAARRSFWSRLTFNFSIGQAF